MPRTDFTQEIDGAFANRNAGSRHFSEIARSGNGDMRSDLADDLADYQELAGLGEGVEQMHPQESAAIDSLGAAAPAIAPMRVPVAGEAPPFAAKPGHLWLRKRTPTGTRAPGGHRLVKTTWAQVSAPRAQQMAASGQIQGLGALTMPSTATMLSIGLGLAGGLGLWMLLKKRRAA